MVAMKATMLLVYCIIRRERSSTFFSFPLISLGHPHVDVEAEAASKSQDSDEVSHHHLPQQP